MSATPPALPVEIWHQIFDEVLDDPAVQTSCNTNNFYRFIYAPGSEYQVEARRRNLAAVCQSWRAIAERYAYRNLTIPEYTSIVPTISPLYSVRRLCFERCITRSTVLSAETLEAWCSWIRASQGLVVLEVDVAYDLNPAYALEVILVCAKSVESLRSLRLRWGLPASLSLTNISMSYSEITTLELGRLPPSVESLSLPHLRVLIFEISEPSNRNWDFHKWRLPRLQFLSVLLSNSWGPPFNLGLFQPFASHLVALHLAAIESYPLPVLPFDLNHFPALQDLTLCTIPLLISAPLGADHPLRTIHVRSWDHRAFLNLTSFPSNTFCALQTVTIFLESHSWGHLGSWQLDPSPFNYACDSLDQLTLEENVTLLDKNGLTLKEWRKQVGWDDWFLSTKSHHTCELMDNTLVNIALLPAKASSSRKFGSRLRRLVYTALRRSR